MKKQRDISQILNSIDWAERIVNKKLPAIAEGEPGHEDRKWLREAAFSITLKEILKGKYTGRLDELP